MFRPLGHAVLIFTLLAATGAHWAVLQSIAWTGMLAVNLRTNSLPEAVQKTFDGQHPCCLCKRISAGKKSENKSEFSALLKKLEFDSKGTPFVFNAPQAFMLLPADPLVLLKLEYKPPTPPPRPSLA